METYQNVLEDGKPVVIGKGSFGKISLVENSKGERFARKECTRDKYQFNTIKEKNIMEHLCGSIFIVQLIDSIENEKGGVDIIMELCEGSLFDLIKIPTVSIVTKQLSQPIVNDVIRDIAKGLAFMREKNISHCDLKPENILWKKSDTSESGYRFLLSDFGNALEGTYMYEYIPIQTSQYRCMENFMKFNSIVSCDVPSLACIVYELITGSYLANLTRSSDMIREQLDAIGSDVLETYSYKYNETLYTYLSEVCSTCGFLSEHNSSLYLAYDYLNYTKREELTDLIKRMLLPFPSKRLQPKDIFNHPAVQ
jgi:serine/threonine protein kinase